jgi:hypothetical protein
MSRPPALTPQQQDEVRLRLAAGEGQRALAREYNVSEATIRRLSSHSSRVRTVAEKVAEAQTALAALPIGQQHQALTLADKLRSISNSLAAAAELGAKTAHRLHALANSEVERVDDANPFGSIESLRNVGILTKLANESAATPLSLLAANKGFQPPSETDSPPSIDPAKLSSKALQELLDARG